MRRSYLTKTVAAAILFSLLTAGVYAQKSQVTGDPAPTLGTYPDSTAFEGANVEVTPSSAPTGALRFTARTSAEFQGVISVDPATGVVRVTNARPAGVYTVDLTATASGGLTSTASFPLTVISEKGCSPFANTNLTGSFSGSTGGGTTPQFGSVADFNNDGIQDYAVGVFTGNKVSVFAGIGDGTFGAAVDLPAPASASTQFTAVGDFNGDGNTDIAASNVNASSLSVWPGNGDGTFGTRVDIATNATPRSLVAADFNNDGKLDLASVSSSATVNGVGIHLGNGDGTFAAVSTIGIGGTAFALVVGEFTGDTNLDLFTGVTTSGRLLTGDGLGGFTITTVGTFASNTEWASTGDFNGDGNLDVAIDNISGTNNMNILLGNGAGGFADAPGSPFTVVGTGVFGNATGDLDGDGDLDLLVSNLTATTVTVFRGDGTGAFSSVGTLTGFTGPRGVNVADLNNDGRQDVVIVDRSGAAVQTRLGACAVDITTDSLPDGTQGQPYNSSILASGGTPPYTFGGTGLPADLSVGAGGTITGTPSVNGSFFPIFTATDSSTLSGFGRALGPVAGVTTYRVIPLTIGAVAEQVTVGGRVTTSDGRPAFGSIVTMTDSGLNIRLARVNPFGYYQFDGVTTGQTYTFDVQAKGLQFTQQVVPVNGPISDLNFVASP
ncbi:MAG: VCBS repeat-containing protein [Aridibacter famidurans]|nr:VCBS repeat-containing protein [Aridibacter famidurans]